MTGFPCSQKNTRSATIFSRFACFWLLFFLFSALGPAATACWLQDLSIPSVLTAPNQPGDHIADTAQQFEAEIEFSKEILLVSSEPCVVSTHVAPVTFVVSFSPYSVSFREYWRVPACPRPPPSAVAFLS